MNITSFIDWLEMDLLTVLAILSFVFNVVYSMGYIWIQDNFFEAFLLGVTNVIIILGILNPNAGGILYDKTDGQSEGQTTENNN